MKVIEIARVCLAAMENGRDRVLLLVRDRGTGRNRLCSGPDAPLGRLISEVGTWPQGLKLVSFSAPQVLAWLDHVGAVRVKIDPGRLKARVEILER